MTVGLKQDDNSESKPWEHHDNRVFVMNYYINESFSKHTHNIFWHLQSGVASPALENMCVFDGPS